MSDVCSMQEYGNSHDVHSWCAIFTQFLYEGNKKPLFTFMCNFVTL
jgi:hypothetical protein